jgi:tetratricopeptide (TPR) repeat protein
VLAKVRDEAADATVGLGRRLLQRIFGSRSEEDALPGTLQDLIVNPNDDDALGSLRHTVWEALTADPDLAAEVQGMLTAAGVVIQKAEAGGDISQTVFAGTVSGPVYISPGPSPVPSLDQPTIEPRYQLPAVARFFTGRKAELDRLYKAVATPGGVPSGAVAIHAINGGAGVGKTALVVRLAHDLSARYEDGQYFIDLQAYTANATVIDPAVALSRLLVALGVPGHMIPESLDDRSSYWRDKLHGLRILVVLDNALNHEQIKPLLPGASESLVLITSRNRMIGHGEIPSLALDVFTESEAVALFTQIAGSHRLAMQNEDVIRVVSSCGYLALAVELAASHLVSHAGWRVSDLADHLENSFRVDNANIVETLVALSYRDLSLDLKRAFRFIGLHPGTMITPEDVAALTNCTLADASRMLEDLYQIHLVEDLPHGAYRCRIHDLIRDYAVKLAKQEDSEAERAAALSRLLDAYLFYSATINEALRCLNHRSIEVANQPPEGVLITSFGEALSWMDERYPNMIACANLAQAISMYPHAWKIPEMLAYFLRIRGHLPEASYAHSAALKAAQDQSDLPGQAAALYNLGIVERLTGNAAGARDRLHKALEAYTDLDDPLGQAETLRALGILDRLTGNYGNAKEKLDRALVLHLTEDNRLGEAWVLGAQGILNRLTGWFISARDCFERALGILLDLGDKLGEAWMLNELGSLDRLTGRYDDAQIFLCRAIDLFLDLGDQFSQAWATCQLGVIDRLTGAYPSARQRFDYSLRIVRSLGKRFAEARILCELSVIDRLDGDYLTARSRLDDALKIYRAIKDRLGEAWALCELAVLDEMTRDYAGSRSRLRWGIAIYRDLGDQLGEAWTLNALGVVDRLTGNFPNDQSGTDAMLTAFQNNQLGTAWTRSALGVLGRITGDYADARTNLQYALEVHDRIGNRPGKAWTLGTLGVIDALTRDYSGAYGKMQSAKDMYAGLGNSLGEAWMLRELAVLERQDTKLDDAILHLEEARRIYTAIDDRLGIAETLVEMGELCRETGRTGDAQGLWQEAIAIFNELGLAADASYVQQRFG